MACVAQGNNTNASYAAGCSREVIEDYCGTSSLLPTKPPVCDWDLPA